MALSSALVVQKENVSGLYACRGLKLRELHGSFQLSKRASDALDHSQKVVTWLFRATLDPSQKVVTQLVNATLDHSQKALTQQKPNLVHFFICAVFHTPPRC